MQLADAALLFRAGISTALFGPGQYKVSHTADEYVELDKVIKGTRILAAASIQLTSE
jgi:acetylornithine deacetylase/succinyl-diaminopimelate desuccinylase-like protein